MDTVQRFMTIRQTAAAGYDTEFHMRLMLKQGRLPGFFSGRTFKVNVPMLCKQLDLESLNQAGGDRAQAELAAKLRSEWESTI